MRTPSDLSRRSTERALLAPHASSGRGPLLCSGKPRRRHKPRPRNSSPWYSTLQNSNTCPCFQARGRPAGRRSRAVRKRGNLKTAQNGQRELAHQHSALAHALQPLLVPEDLQRPFLGRHQWQETAPPQEEVVHRHQGLKLLGLQLGPEIQFRCPGDSAVVPALGLQWGPGKGDPQRQWGLAEPFPARTSRQLEVA